MPVSFIFAPRSGLVFILSCGLFSLVSSSVSSAFWPASLSAHFVSSFCIFFRMFLPSSFSTFFLPAVIAAPALAAAVFSAEATFLLAYAAGDSRLVSCSFSAIWDASLDFSFADTAASLTSSFGILKEKSLTFGFPFFSFTLISRISFHLLIAPTKRTPFPV
jgi:hypothetical protein